MEIIYNVKTKFKNDNEFNEEKIKKIINKKLLKIILELENQEIIIK